MSTVLSETHMINIDSNKLNSDLIAPPCLVLYLQHETKVAITYSLLHLPKWDGSLSQSILYSALASVANK